MNRTTTDSAVDMKASLEAGMHNENSAVEAIGRLEYLADNSGAIMEACCATDESLDRHAADLRLVLEALRHSVEREAGLRDALTVIADESVFNQQRFAEDSDADYFLRCFKAVKDRARAALDRRAGT